MKYLYWGIVVLYSIAPLVFLGHYTVAGDDINRLYDGERFSRVLHFPQKYYGHLPVQLLTPPGYVYLTPILMYWAYTYFWGARNAFFIWGLSTLVSRSFNNQMVSGSVVPIVSVLVLGLLLWYFVSKRYYLRSFGLGLFASVFHSVGGLLSISAAFGIAIFLRDKRGVLATGPGAILALLNFKLAHNRHFDTTVKEIISDAPKTSPTVSVGSVDVFIPSIQGPALVPETITDPWFGVNYVGIPLLIALIAAGVWFWKEKLSWADLHPIKYGIVSSLTIASALWLYVEGPSVDRLTNAVVSILAIAIGVVLTTKTKKLTTRSHYIVVMLLLNAIILGSLASTAGWMGMGSNQPFEDSCLRTPKPKWC